MGSKPVFIDKKNGILPLDKLNIQFQKHNEWPHLAECRDLGLAKQCHQTSGMGLICREGSEVFLEAQPLAFSCSTFLSTAWMKMQKSCLSNLQLTQCWEAQLMFWVVESGFYLSQICDLASKNANINLGCYRISAMSRSREVIIPLESTLNWPHLATTF